MSRSKLRKSLRALIQRHKNTVCVDCGIQYSQDTMTFDHLRDKKFNLGGSLRGLTEEDILEEIKKTEVVCLFCHRDREYRRGRMGRSYLK